MHAKRIDTRSCISYYPFFWTMYCTELLACMHVYVTRCVLTVQ